MRDHFQYGYDRNSNRTWRDATVNTAFGEVYQYDNLNQITSFKRGTLNAGKTDVTGTPSRTQTWDFDALGNFDGVNTDGTNQTRSHNKQNEITSISSATTPTYDANGNLTKDETGRTFEYDAWNRLVRAKNSPGTTIWESEYDALFRRVSTTESGNTTDFYFSDQWQVIEERVGGTAKVQYVWSPVYVDALVLRDRDVTGDSALEERLWVMQDANYNVTGLYDGNGNVVERYAYDPFGAVTVYDGNWGSRSGSSYGWMYLHQGGRWEATIGLYHFRYRYLSPTLGRWTTNDPIGYAAGDVGLYRVVGNQPTNTLDPTGMTERTIVIVVSTDFYGGSLPMFWQSAWAGLDALSPLGSSVHTLYASNIKIALEELDSQGLLKDGDTIFKIRVCGHTGTSDALNAKQYESSLKRLRELGIKYIEFESCSEASDSRIENLSKIHEITGAQVSANTGGYCVWGTGDWITVGPNGTRVKSNSPGNLLTRQVAGGLYWIFGSNRESQKRPKTGEGRMFAQGLPDEAKPERSPRIPGAKIVDSPLYGRIQLTEDGRMYKMNGTRMYGLGDGPGRR